MAEARAYSPVLDVIRIVAVTGVVAVHVIADAVRPDSPAAVLLLRSLLATAVPAFIMISGALNLSPAAMRHGTGSFLARRLRRLLPATVVWTALYLVLMSALPHGEPLTWRGAVEGILAASTAPHLYFLALILGLTLITPVLSSYVGESGRRAWWVGAIASAWACATMMQPVLTEGLLGEAVPTLQLSALTWFLPFIGYYALGRAALIAPPPRRWCWTLLALAVPVLTGLVAWTYSAPGTQDPLGRALQPTYTGPLVMLLSLALVVAVLGLGRSRQVGEQRRRRLRSLGSATFGVFLVHFALLVVLREVGFPQGSVGALLALTALVTVVSFALSLLARTVPGLRSIF